MKKIIYLLPLLLLTISSFEYSNHNIKISNIDLGDSVKFISPEFKLTSTGQTLSYDKDGYIIYNLKKGYQFYGQDANYTSGAKMSYTNNGDSTITDNNTGLMWQQIPSSKPMTWEEAKKYCEELTLGGYTDWRMPSVKELYSISNFAYGWPYIDTNFFSLVQEELTKDEQYWSSNLYVGVAGEQKPGVSPPGHKMDNHSGNRMPPPPQDRPMPNSPQKDGKFMQKAFGVNYATGHIKAYAANARGPIGGKYIRAVRGKEYGINEFKDNNDKTITDSSTGLMWSKDDSGSGMNWEESLSYAENSELAGYNDWRLPNIKELQSIVDYNYSPSAQKCKNKGAAINKLFNSTQIKNEAGKEDYAYYWSSTSARFRKGEKMCYAWYVAFGMAVDKDGQDIHGAGAVRFDTKYKGENKGEGAERTYNFVRLVRNIK